MDDHTSDILSERGSRGVPHGYPEVMYVHALLFMFGASHLLLHAGPLLGIRHEQAIRGGTDPRLFGSEVLLFTAYAVAANPIMDSAAGRAVVSFHLATHLLYLLMSLFNLDGTVALALSRREDGVARWAASQLGLLVDTLSHVFVVSLLGLSLGPGLCLVLTLPALAVYGFMTSRYAAMA